MSIVVGDDLARVRKVADDIQISKNLRSNLHTTTQQSIRHLLVWCCCLVATNIEGANHLDEEFSSLRNEGLDLNAGFNLMELLNFIERLMQPTNYYLQHNIDNNNHNNELPVVSWLLCDQQVWRSHSPTPRFPRKCSWTTAAVWRSLSLGLTPFHLRKQSAIRKRVCVAIQKPEKYSESSIIRSFASTLNDSHRFFFVSTKPFVVVVVVVSGWIIAKS